MELLKATKISNGLCIFSPDGSMLAYVLYRRLIVLKTANFTDLYSFTCQDNISFIEWSPDSQLILCGIKDINLVQVFRLGDADWSCNIEEGSFGLVDAKWSSDSRHILSTSEMFLKITVWSLITKSICYINHPKECSNYLDFNKDGSHMAVAEYKDFTDVISIYRCNDWEKERTFKADMEEMEGVKWSPCDDVLCVWNSMFNYKILIFSLEGQCLFNYSAYQNSLAINCVSWSTSGWLAVLSYDSCVRIMKRDRWDDVVSLNIHLEESTAVYKEVTLVKENSQKNSHFYERVSCLSNFILPQKNTKSNILFSHPEIVLFNHKCTYMASSISAYPTCLFIWSLQTMKLVAILTHLNAISNAAWNSFEDELIVCTGKDHYFVWCPEGATVVSTEQNVDEVNWQPRNSNTLVLKCEDYMQVTHHKM